MGTTWADKAREVIGAVLREHPEDTPARRAALQAAYPFGVREHYPYKIWCREVRRATKPQSKRHKDQHTLI